MAEQESRKTPARAATGENKPWDASGMIEGTVEELRQLLDAKHVISEPMSFGPTTVVPLVSVGFAFGAGGGGGSGEDGEGGGGGGGAGGGVKPVAVLVIQDGAVRLERIPDEPSGLDRLASAAANALDRRGSDASSEDSD